MLYITYTSAPFMGELRPPSCSGKIRYHLGGCHSKWRSVSAIDLVLSYGLGGTEHAIKENAPPKALCLGVNSRPIKLYWLNCKPPEGKLF